MGVVLLVGDYIANMMICNDLRKVVFCLDAKVKENVYVVALPWHFEDQSGEYWFLFDPDC